MHPDEVHAVITVQPEVFHRGRHLSWLTAVSEASKQVCEFLNDSITRFHVRIAEDMRISFEMTLEHLSTSFKLKACFLRRCIDDSIITVNIVIAFMLSTHVRAAA